MMQDQVTVVIPFYNSEKYINKAIQSVYQQTFDRWRLILINDASIDQSVVKVTPFLDDPRVTLLQNGKNMGQSHSLNLALKQIITPYFVQLDSDDWLFPHTLEILVNEAKKQSADVAVLGGNTMVYVEDQNGNRRMAYLRKSRDFKDKYDFMLSNLSLWPRFYRTSAIKKLGGWPTTGPDQGRLLEDKRMLFQILGGGYSLYWIDQTLYNYRRHGRNLTTAVQAYGDAFEKLIRDTLKAWGDQYHPLFKTYGPGWKKIKSLVPNTGEKNVDVPLAVKSTPASAKEISSGSQKSNQQKSRIAAPQKNKQSKGLGTGPYTGPGTAPGTGHGTAPGTGPGT